MTQERREAMLTEYQALAGFIQQFFTLRASILGLGAAMAGALLTTSLGTQGLHEVRSRRHYSWAYLRFGENDWIDYPCYFHIRCKDVRHFC